jgi:thioredoxin-like negative regulator of GroEL
MKNVHTFSLLLFAGCLLISTALFSQTQLLKTPNASPKALVGQTIGLTDVYVSYHRPAVKEREVWGNLVPYGAVWRAGANDNTVIKFTDNVKIEGKDLPAGKYGLHMIPGKEAWTIIFSHNHSSWGSYSYVEEEDALRVKVYPAKSDAFHESLTYVFEPVENGKAHCVLLWENMKVPFKIETDVHEAVLAGMRDDLRSKAGWSWQGYNEAAAYCLNNDVNHEEALGWASRSVGMGPNPQNMAVKAKLVSKVKGEEAMWSSMEKDLSTLPCTWKEYDAAARFAMQHEKYDKALAYSGKAISMNPTMTAMMTKATILKTKGDTKGAEKVKKEALAKGTNGELNSYGYQLLFSGKGEQALDIFLANTEKNPEDPNVWDSLGECYVNLGKKEEAVKALKKSLSLNPPPNVRANSMKLLGQMGVELEAVKP